MVLREHFSVINFLFGNGKKFYVLLVPDVLPHQASPISLRHRLP